MVGDCKEEIVDVRAGETAPQSGGHLSHVGGLSPNLSAASVPPPPSSGQERTLSTPGVAHKPKSNPQSCVDANYGCTVKLYLATVYPALKIVKMLYLVLCRIY